jgi:hypothetical protein
LPESSPATEGLSFSITLSRFTNTSAARVTEQDK